MTGNTTNAGLPLFEAARAMGVPFQEPVLPISRTVEANGLRFHLLDWGAEGKPPLVLMHGAFQTAHSWDFTALALRDHFHVRALDARGHGDSDWAPDGDYSHDAMQQDLDAIFPALGLDRFILIGLSMGGRNAMLYASRRPETVDRLVVVDIGPETQQQGRQNIAKFVAGAREGPFEEFLERAHQYNPRRPLEQLRGSLLNNLRELPNGNWAWKYDARMRDRFQNTPARAEELETAISAIRCPTLVVRGEQSDVLSAGAAERLQQMIPASRLVSIPRAGHLVPGDNPVDFIRAVRDFLEQA